MIVGVGIDILSTTHLTPHARVRVFTAAELAECRRTGTARERLAGKFAAKEAFLKALGTGLGRGIHLRDIEVLNEPDGQPFLIPHATALRASRQLRVRRIHVSVTHSAGLAAAIVVLDR